MTVVCALGVSIADEVAAQLRIEFIRPEDRVRELFAARDFSAASVYIDERLARDPQNAIMLYNAACARSQLGEVDTAAEILLRAVKAGYNDFSYIRRDADLAPIRQHRIYRALMDALEAADYMLAQRQLDMWLKAVDAARFQIVPDDRLHLTLVLDDSSPSGSLIRESIASHLDIVKRELFDGLGLSQHVNIILADRIGAGPMIGQQYAYGVYRHNQRTLIAADADVCLRHELVHALHHSHMDRLGQQHPIWIEEGLAVLFEQYDLHSGAAKFLITDRDNQARQLLREDRLLPWASLIAATPSDLNIEGHRFYPQLRSMMRFIDEHVGVAAWFACYTGLFDLDDTGQLALEVAFDQPMAGIEESWREWLENQAIVVGRSARVSPPTFASREMDWAPAIDGELMSADLPSDEISRCRFLPLAPAR